LQVHELSDLLKQNPFYGSRTNFALTT